MNLPNLPTDNLYKFVALSGVVIALLSIVLPYREARRLHILTIELESDMAVFEVALDSALHASVIGDSATLHAMVTDTANPTIRDVRHRVERGMPPGYLEAVYANVLSGKRVTPRDTTAVLARIMEMKREQVRQSYRVRLLRYYTEQLAHLRWIVKGGLGLGLLMASIGFLLWHKRLQQPQDRALAVALSSPKAAAGESGDDRLTESVPDGQP